MKRVTSQLLSKHCPGTLHGFGIAGAMLGDHLNSLGVKGIKYFHTNQMHGDNIVSLSKIPPNPPFIKGGMGGFTLESDSFITSEPGIVCYVRTADCVPIFLHDPRVRAIAAIHAGWRGTAKKIAAKTVDRMMQEFGCKKENILAAIGPAIGGECYEVGEDVYNAVIARSVKRLRGEAEANSRKEIPRFTRNRLRNLPYTIDCGGLPRRSTQQVECLARNDKHLINLPSINRTILQEAGLLAQNIDLIPICSHCDKRFASYRRDKSEERRQVNFIMLV